MLQDKSKSSVSKIVVSIPTECEALLVGTVFLIHIEILTVIIVTGKKKSITGSLSNNPGSEDPQKVSSSTLSQSMQLPPKLLSTSKCSNSREICLSGTVMVTSQSLLLSYSWLLT